MNIKKLFLFIGVIASLGTAVTVVFLTYRPSPTKTKIPQVAQEVIPAVATENRQEIQLCSTLPLSGELSVLGNQIFEGMNLMFNKIRQDPQFPFFFRLHVRDDQADMAETRKNVRRLIKSSKSPLFISLLGTDTMATLLPFINEGKMLALFPVEGSTAHRCTEYKNAIFFRASYEQEVDALINYAANTLQRKQIAIFYEASEWGEAVLKALKKVLAKYQLPLVTQASYPQQTLNISRAVKELSASSPNAILCVAQSRPAYHFIQEIINKGLFKTAILGLSSLIPIQETIKESRGVEIITSSVVPDPKRSALVIAQEYRSDLEKFSPNRQPTPYSFEGYINAALLVEFAKTTKIPWTTTSLMQTIEKLGHVRFKGIELKFNPSTRTLSHNVWLNTGHDKEWVLATK
ncbi:MAG: ABC transporter substrate-binding protein [Candidatus Babeliales bacterium]|jgi:ABC-type branched-subunit amino acid transport system substrate-binding protein